MNIFVILLLAIVLMIVLLRKKIPIGPAILTGGMLIWVLVRPEFGLLKDAGYQMLTMHRTYDLIFALYFVVCLEIELRTSGCLKGMMQYLHHLIPSTKVTLAVMPAFLGLLPSIGGARFSAPIVEAASEGQKISAESKAAINFWFRHIFEFSSPIVPGMILACTIAGIGVGDLIIHLAWATFAAFALGWLVLIRPLKIDESIKSRAAQEEVDLAKVRTDFMLSLLPIFVVFFLMVFGRLSASVSMGIVAAGMVPLLFAFKRKVSAVGVFKDAVEGRLFRDVGCILFFIQLLDVTGVLAQIVAAFDGAPLPAPVIMAIVSFIIGVLTGLSQGHVAVVMPIVAALSPGDIDMVGLTLVFGVAGQMVTPTHVCLMVTLDYFKADFFKTLWPCIVTQVLLLVAFVGVSMLTWG